MNRRTFIQALAALTPTLLLLRVGRAESVAPEAKPSESQAEPPKIYGNCTISDDCTMTVMEIEGGKMVVQRQYRLAHARRL